MMKNQTKTFLKVLIPFLVVMVAFLSVANYGVYRVLALLFSLQNPSQLIILGTILGLLSVAFLLSTILGMQFYNFFTRSIYTISATWMGAFSYLLLGSMLCSLVILVTGGVPTYLGLIFVSTTILVSLYGIFHAQDIQVKEVEVQIAHLPTLWQGRRAVWISDIHLGQISGRSFMQKVVDRVSKIPHDIVFIGGDLFDGTSAPDLQNFVQPLRDLTAPLGVYFITGNHEEFGDNSKFLSAVRSVGITTIIDEKIEIDGMQIIGVDYHNAAQTEGFRSILSSLSIDKEKPSILLKHEPKDIEVAHEAGISFQISGHTHKAQLWPLEYVARLTYKGFAYGLKAYKNMQVFVSSGVGTWGPPMRVGTDSEVVLFTFTR